MSRLAALLLLALTACGGGGGGSSPPEGQPAPSRPGLFYGYYGSCLGCYAATKDHVNLLMEVPSWTGLASAINDMNLSGLPTILYTPTDAPSLTYLLTELRNANVLRYVVALYPLDEPNGMADADVMSIVATQRAVASQFVELSNVKMAVIYGPGPELPGLSGFDWVGFDDYNAGDGAAAGELTDFEARLLPGQRVILVPGGADPWRTDPAAFYNRAQLDSLVLIIMPFIWQDYTGGKGIADNGEAYVYRPYGLLIKGST